VALVIVALIMAQRSVPNWREGSQRSFDTVGSLASIVAVVGLIFFLQEGPERGWIAPVTLVSLLVGAVAAVGFVAWELRQRSPLLKVRLFRERSLASGSVALLAVFGVQAGIFVVLYPARCLPCGPLCPGLRGRRNGPRSSSVASGAPRRSPPL
jgi:hypothetical protein